METALLETAIPVGGDVNDAATVIASEPAATSVVPESGEVVVAAPASATPAVVDNSAQLAALQAQVAALTDRIAASPAPSQFDYRQLTSAIVAAEGERRADYDRQQAARADLQPPTFTEDQKTALVSDPDALIAAMQAWARYGAKAALAQVAPHLSDAARKANIAFELAGPNSDAVADWAFNRGRDFAVAGGMSADDYNGVSQTVYDYLWQASQREPNPQLHFAKMTLNPQAISTAAHMAHTQRGGVVNGNGSNGGGVAQPTPIVDKRAPAPTVGAGTHRSDATPRPANANLAYAEQKLGRKLSVAEVKRLNDVTKKYAAL